MKAIILAGGRGERLKPITNTIPKPMVEVGGKPILLQVINQFKRHGITDFIIALCYMPNVITDFFGNGKSYGVSISYTYEDQKKPLGTAGAISFAKNLIDDTFIVTYGDILRDLDIRKMINFHKKMNSFATINIYKRMSEDAKSMVLIDKSNKVLRFIERPNQVKNKYIWVNGSFYVFEKEVFNYIPDEKKLDFGSDIFPKIIKTKKIFAYPSRGYFIDIGNIEKLNLARKTLKKNRQV